MYKLWNALNESKKYKWVELSHPLNNDSPVWSGIPEGSVELGKVVFDWGNPILECVIQTFKFPGQFGTHIDFPGHFIKGSVRSEAFSVDQGVYPLCVVDISEKAKKDPRYVVTVDDIKEYEAQYGQIPDGAFVALRTDWYKNWPDMDALSGAKEDGSENFPGWSLEALKYIYETRNAGANGHETLDTDASAETERTGDLTCERYVLQQGKLQIELLANLDKVAPAGAVLIAAWPRIENAVGLPVRVWAVTE
ncbi:MAG: cyclase family protein [Eubacteriaceae bacterium]|nr:cyclase family protein [Eubacteriaceae bacterium]MBR5995546.1 cyclase family protein [Eubacteriaceae bacterium]